LDGDAEVITQTLRRGASHHNVARARPSAFGFQLAPAGVEPLHRLLGVLERPACVGQDDMAGGSGALDDGLALRQRLLRIEDRGFHLLPFLLFAVAQLDRLDGSGFLRRRFLPRCRLLAVGFAALVPGRAALPPPR
jgi:hypothetical protein